MFTRAERIELMRGALVEMSPIGPLHVEVVTRLNKLLMRMVGDRAEVRIQAPFAASDDSEPEPDVALVPLANYARVHPSTAYLLIEVADSSLRMDRLVKAELYAASGVPEYWIVDLQHDAVEVRTRIVDGRYADVRTCGRADIVRLQAFPDVELRIADLLP